MMAKNFFGQHLERITLKQFLRLLKTHLGVLVQKVEHEKTKVHQLTSLSRREVFTIKELSDFLGMSGRHIHRLIREKALPVYRVVFAVKDAGLISNQLVFSYDEIKDWITKPLVRGNASKGRKRKTRRKEP